MLGLLCLLNHFSWQGSPCSPCQCDQGYRERATLKGSTVASEGSWDLPVVLSSKKHWYPQGSELQGHRQEVSTSGGQWGPLTVPGQLCYDHVISRAHCWHRTVISRALDLHWACAFLLSSQRIFFILLSINRKKHCLINVHCLFFARVF